jgi:hypothetical protein
MSDEVTFCTVVETGVSRRLRIRGEPMVILDEIRRRMFPEVEPDPKEPAFLRAVAILKSAHGKR